MMVMVGVWAVLGRRGGHPEDQPGEAGGLSAAPGSKGENQAVCVSRVCTTVHVYAVVSSMCVLNG